MTKKSVIQDWALELSFMQQSVLIAAIRAPDGIKKDHAVKVLMRWYRRCLVISAFDASVLTDPFSPGGGSFTGPFTVEHAAEYRIVQMDWAEAQDWWANVSTAEHRRELFDGMRKVYLRHVDELPHHFQLHLMHAAQIMGYKHSNPAIAKWWLEFYHMIVNDAHLFPESEELMDQRLGDTEAGWRAREEVTAR